MLAGQIIGIIDGEEEISPPDDFGNVVLGKMPAAGPITIPQEDLTAAAV